MKRNHRTILRCTGIAIAVLCAIAVLPSTAFAQITTGLAITKSCPQEVNSGAAFQCTFTVQNLDPVNTVINLAVTNQAPFPGGTPAAVDCLQGGIAVTTLGSFGTVTDTCAGTLDETAPATCDGGTRFTDQVAATGIDTNQGGIPLPVSASTTNSPVVIPPDCNDNLFCTDDSCSEGVCSNVPHSCDDNNLCTTDSCDENSDTCVNAPVVCPSDNNACNGPESCDPTTGDCTSGPPLNCDDSDACTEDSCDPVLGCQHSTIDCNDNDACTTDTCDPASGCGNAPITCDDNDVCTDDTCDPASGCVFTPDNTNDPSCIPSEEICRTPGFWGTHGGEEKARSENITQDLLDAFIAANGSGPIICGTEINNTDVGNVNSALEAICVAVKGDPRRQLARQLTAAALNCIISTAVGTDVCTAATGDVCAGTSIADLFSDCNEACATGGDLDDCIAAIDCFNNGGTFENGECTPGGEENCHTRELDNGGCTFQPPGPAGSSDACNEARKNDVFVPAPLP
jgi:Dictyostelium (slime mold) repeat